MNPAIKSIRSLFAKVSPLALLGMAMACAVVVFFPVSLTEPPLDVPDLGEIAKKTVIAPFTFDVEKTPQELDRERKEACAKVLLVLDFNQDALRQARRKFASLKDALAAEQKTGRLASAAGLSEPTVRALKKFPRIVDDALADALPVLDKGVLDTRIAAAGEGGAELRNRAPEPGPSLVYDKDFVCLRRNSFESTVRWTDIPLKQAAIETAFEKVKARSTFDTPQLTALYELLAAYIQPNIVVNIEETELRKEKAMREVLPIMGKVLKETELVRTHQVVTADVVEKLYSLRKAQKELDDRGGKLTGLLRYIGDLLLILLSLALSVFYVFSFSPGFKKDHKSLMAAASILVVQLAIIRLGIFIDAKMFENSSGAMNLVSQYIIPTCMASIVTAIFFSVRLSIVMSIFVSVFFGIALGNNFPMFLVSLMSGCVAGYVFRDIRYRFDFVKAMPPLLLIYGILIFIFEFMGRGFTLVGLMQDWGLACISCAAAVIVAMVLAMVIENLFDIATNMTLIELSDMNHPILKRLSIEATGTYNHCVLVGNLAESAAERIGANSLFARVASYYHDIGKIEKANYFIENMTASEKSKHNKLSPNLSALIISAHVKEGVDLAHKYKLPRVIREAIMQHHGTSTVSYFYEKAREQDPHNQVLEEQFRYAGPLPQTRENAIIMLADSVEAASRSLAASSQKLLRDLVKKIIRDKFMSAQLDQSNLTLRDLDGIVEGFMPILQGIFHTRDLKKKER
jgi:putative nucleotidyltransferase with HDIG domain